MSRKREKSARARPAAPAATSTAVAPDRAGRADLPVEFWSRHDRFLLLAALATAFLAYLGVWHAGFIWDDSAHVTRPDLYPWHGLWRIWFEPGATQQYYPLLHSTFWLEHRLWGDSASAYHVTNVVLHLAASFLLYRVLRRLEVPGAWLGAGLFAVHPVCVESVAWISEQKNTLSTVLYFSSALAYLRFDRERRAGWYAGASALFLAAVAAKSVTATLPAALLVAFWWKRGGLSWRRDAWPLLPWFALSAVAASVTAWMEKTSVGATGEAYALGLVERFLVAGRAAWFYLGKLLVPVDLTFIYPHWDMDRHVAWQYIFSLALAGVAIVTYSLRGRTRGPLASVLLYVGTLFPALGFIDVFPFTYSYVADHFQYLAAAAMLPALAAAFTLAAGRAAPSGRIALKIGAGGIIVALAVLTGRQTAMYADSETLWRTTIARNPACWMAFNNLGADLLQADRLAEALPLAERAVTLAPRNAAAHTNLGTARQMQGRLAEAVAQFEAALALDPRSADAHADLAAALMLVGRNDDALAHVQKALALDPDLAKACVTLGNLLLAGGRAAEALAQYQRAVAIEPGDTEARTNLGTALARQGRLDEAVAEFQAAASRAPNSAVTQLNLGNALLQQAKPEQAVAHFQRALTLDPKSAIAHNNLGLALLELSRLDEALGQFQQALALDPNDAEAHRNAGTVLFKLGRLDEANTQFQEAARSGDAQSTPHP